MEKAIKIDPEFAMAYRSMAVIMGQNLGNTEWSKYMRKAMEFSHRLPHRERYIIQGDFYWYSDKTKAIEAYEKVLQLYPLDRIANGNLGSLYENYEEWDKLQEMNQVLIRNKTEFPGSIARLALSYQAKGLYEKAGEIIEYGIKHFQDGMWKRIYLAENYCLQGKFDLALIEADKAISLAPGKLAPLSMKADIYFYNGNFNKAEKIYQKGLEQPHKNTKIEAIYLMGHVHITRGRLAEAENRFKQAFNMTIENKMSGWQHYFHEYIGRILFIRGKYEESLKELNQSLAITKKLDSLFIQRWGLYFTAMCYLKMRSLDRAQKAEAEIREWASKSADKRFIRWYTLFLGQKALDKQNLPEAIDHFNRAISLLPNDHSGPMIDYLAPFFDAQAWAYREAGQLDEAQDVFEKITMMTYGRLETGDIYARAFYNLGKIYQQKGWKGKAIESYNKFIELWKNCDPIFQPLVEDARKKLKELAPGPQPNK